MTENILLSFLEDLRSKGEISITPISFPRSSDWVHSKCCYGACSHIKCSIKSK